MSIVDKQKSRRRGLFRKKRRKSLSLSMKSTRRAASVSSINDYISAEKSGWLQKWTNYIKGYRQRWFVLDSNAVLSYYSQNFRKIYMNKLMTVNLQSELRAKLHDPGSAPQHVQLICFAN